MVSLRRTNTMTKGVFNKVFLRPRQEGRETGWEEQLGANPLKPVRGN